LVEALSALLARTGKGSISEIDMSGMIAEVEAARIDSTEEQWDRTGESVTMRLAVDLPVELYDRIKRDSVQRRLSVPDAIRKLLESVYPEARHGRG
jgi:hypothetical protein